MRDELNISFVSKFYKKGKISANKQISMMFSPGEITAITGHNGAGKSTLLKQIMGIIKPDEGTITFKGTSLIKDVQFAKENIGMMPQFQVPLAGVTVRQGIKSVLKIRGIDKPNCDNLTSEIIKELKIEEWQNIKGEKLSGGLQRLTSFAMTVATPLPIIMLDEPTNDVDPVRRTLIWKKLRNLADQNCIVIIVSHNILEINQYADRLLLLDHGRLIKNERTKNSSLESTSQHELEVYVKPIARLEEIPSQLKYFFDNENNRYIFRIENNQMSIAMEFLVEYIEKGDILDYHLCPLPLEAIYREATDERI